MEIEEYLKYLKNYKKYPTDIFGLKFYPSLEPEVSNDEDIFLINLTPNITVSDGNKQFSDANCKLLAQEIQKQNKKNNSTKCYVEIGISRNFESYSSSEVFLNNKENNVYIGFDISPGLQYKIVRENSIYQYNCNSKEKTKVVECLDKLGIKNIDILFIDGAHDINTKFNDWSYVEYLSKDGVVILHDTNIHSGGYCLMEAINENIFNKKKYFENSLTDMGMGVITFR